MPSPDGLVARATRQEPSWADLLDQTIGGGGIRPVFQPIVDLDRLTVTGFEALARFDEGPPVGPDLWFAEAHRQGRLAELEAAVLERSLAARQALPPNTFLTVNLEPESLHSPLVTEVFRRQGSLAGVVVEITEHRSLGDPDSVRRALEPLRRAGALVAMDDAGAGYAGLQQILELRPDVLKLDRALIEGLDVDEAKSALVEMMGFLAGRLDSWIVAEGIETMGEARRCRQLGVPLAQGWFFARPDRPWAGLRPEVEELRDLDLTSAAPGLRPFLTVAPTVVAPGRVDLAELERAGVDTVVMVDSNQRPLGIVAPTIGLADELLSPLVANASEQPVEVARRLVTRSADERIPVVVTDDAGRYLGIVTLRRLLGAV